MPYNKNIQWQSYTQFYKNLTFLQEAQARNVIVSLAKRLIINDM